MLGGGDGSGAGAGRLTGVQVPGSTSRGVSGQLPGGAAALTDCRVIKVYDIADDVEREEFARNGTSYSSPRLTFFTDRVSTGCGAASSQVGPFYCPADRKLYLDLGFLEQLQRRFGAQGQFAQAYIVAHEFGHHVQTLTGADRRARALGSSGASSGSVRLELQADCYAGVWSRLADERGGTGIALTEGDVREAVRAAGAVGDDRIQARTAGRVDPESWTHGSAEQRQGWFVRGLRSGSPGSCNTFAGTGGSG